MIFYDSMYRPHSFRSKRIFWRSNDPQRGEPKRKEMRRVMLLFWLPSIYTYTIMYYTTIIIVICIIMYYYCYMWYLICILCTMYLYQYALCAIFLNSWTFPENITGRFAIMAKFWRTEAKGSSQHIYIIIYIYVGFIKIDIWLVVWNMAFVFPYIGNSHPN